MSSEPPPAKAWPPKYDLFGVQVSATHYDQVVATVVREARARSSAIVSLQAVHPIVLASGDQDFRDKVNSFDIVGPDGQPVRWALNLLYGAGLKQRVYGPELMLRVCEQAAAHQLPIYLYGSTERVLADLQTNLSARFPSLKIAGVESPPFRRLSAAEMDDVAERMARSGAAIVFVGLGAPKQDEFAFEFRGRLDAPLVCVGAAFDFHAGSKQMAPVWMQRRGLEWVFRLIQEPRRLWRRYLTTNSLFVFKLGWALARRYVFP